MTTTEAPPTELPFFARVAMQQFNPALQKQIETFADYLQIVIARHATGQTPETSLAYFLYGSNAPWIGEELEAAVEDAVNAWWAWTKAETGDFDIHALEPELADGEVYAERCRVVLDDELAALAKVLPR